MLPDVPGGEKQKSAGGTDAKQGQQGDEQHSLLATLSFLPLFGKKHRLGSLAGCLQ